MNPANLIRMANRIGEFFIAMPDHDEAVIGIATHLQRFWEPRMRREFLGLCESADAVAAISGIVRDAVQAHRALIEPQIRL